MTEFSPSKACADFVSGLTYEVLPEKSRDLLKRDILDWVGCAVAGSAMQFADPVKSVAVILGGKPEASTFGGKEKTDLRTAAMQNGWYGHILEMDDVDRESISHPASPIMPAAFALGEFAGASGKDILTAIAGGFEVMLRVGAAVTPAHYKIWHTTSTTGVMGSAMAAGKLLGLSGEELLWSLGNAGTLAAGLWQFNQDGAMSKFLHTGNAAGNGVLVSLLAKNGFTGAGRILEGSQGFFAGYARQDVNEDLFKDFGKTWRSGTFSFKPYPCCRHTHSSIDAAKSIREQLAEVPGDRIKSLTLHTYGTALNIAGKEHPGNPRDAKFSITFCIATTILGGTPSEESFSEEAIRNPELQSLLNSMTVVNDPAINAMLPQNWASRIEAETEGGRHLEALISVPKGDPDNEFSWIECEAKFRTMTRGILTEDQKNRIVALVKRFEEIDDFGKENFFKIING